MFDRWLQAIQWLRQYSELRFQLLEALSPEDLKFKLPGANLTLGALCRQMGEIQHSYILSFQSFEQNFEYQHSDISVETDLGKLADWWTELDGALFSLLESFSEEAVIGKKIQREPDFEVDFLTQLQIYREALVIFYGKMSIYLKAMNREMPPRWTHWIG